MVEHPGPYAVEPIRGDDIDLVWHGRCPDKQFYGQLDEADIGRSAASAPSSFKFSEPPLKSISSRALSMSVARSGPFRFVPSEIEPSGASTL